MRAGALKIGRGGRDTSSHRRFGHCAAWLETDLVGEILVLLIAFRTIFISSNRPSSSFSAASIAAGLSQSDDAGEVFAEGARRAAIASTTIVGCGGTGRRESGHGGAKSGGAAALHSLLRISQAVLLKLFAREAKFGEPVLKVGR